jgi:DNA repair protein RecO (recombination protein O)
MRVFGEPAYVLHHRHYSETSLTLEVFTPAYGRLGLLAKGARRPSSPWRGLLKPFQPLLIGWVGRGELPILTQAEPHGENLVCRGAALYCGFYLNELLLKLLHRHDPHERLFAVYREALQALYEGQHETASAPSVARGPRLDPIGEEAVLRVFEKRLLDETGYGLVLDRDIADGSAISETAMYDYRLDRGPVRLTDPELHKRIEGVRVRGSSLLALARESLEGPEALRDAKRLMRAILNDQLGGRALHTRDFYRRVVTATPGNTGRETAP